MSLRLRLTTWYLVLLGVALLAFSLLLYYMMSDHLYEMTGESSQRHALHVADTFEAAGVNPDRWRESSSPEWHQTKALLRALETPDLYTDIITAEGTALDAERPNHVTVRTPTWVLSKALEGEQVPFDAHLEDGRLVRVLIRPLSSDPMLFLQVSADHLEAQLTLSRLRTILITGSALLMLLALTIGSSVAREALLPISNMIDTARAIALSKGFARRIEGIARPDELGKLAITFNEMLASLEEAYTVQQRFVADASHELRAPLAIIRGNLELLQRQRGLSDSELAEILGDVQSETARMSRLIGDLLSLARADTGGLTVHRAEVELDAVAIEAFRVARVQADSHVLRIGQLQPARVLGDRDRLKQLLLILIDNALTYTPPGGQITLCLRATSDQAILEVSDTGIGIAPEDLPHIFDRFYRADKARSRVHGGTGLGLSIAQWIVDQHDGQIDVHSEPGKGSTFAVCMPLCP